MRSQLFGFTLPIHNVYEANLTCSLNQAYEITYQLIQQFGGIGSADIQVGHVTIGREIYTRKVETWFNQWDLETECIIRSVLREYGLRDELLRMERLQEALSWRWFKFRETAVIAQIDLSCTIEKDVHLMILIGWNEGANSEHIRFSSEFVQLYFERYHQLRIPCQWQTVYPPTSTRPQPRHYGMRLDTAAKLLKLYEFRELERKTGQIISTRMAGCDHAGISLSTFKKYDKMLYDRWYDVEYKGST